jgi:hypothetical protein
MANGTAVPTTTVPAGAPAGQLNAVDWKKVLKGLAIAIGGAVVIYAYDFITNNPLGWSPFAVAMASSAINLIKIWVQDNS